MSDPFELRLSFSAHLRALNPCDADSSESDEAILLALKHRETMEEDFHAVILEQLRHRDNNINVRANIVYFLEDLVDASKRDKCYSYVRMIERDWSQVVDAAIPLEGVDGLGVVNANAVKYVLQVLHYEHGLWSETSSYGHKLVKDEDRKSFEYWSEYVEKRTEEARPEIREMGDDEQEEEEVDMSWIHGTVVTKGNSPSRTKVTTEPQPISDESMHDVPSPPGSMGPSPSAMDLDMTTPKPPTPPSSNEDVSNDIRNEKYSPTRTFSPMEVNEPVNSKQQPSVRRNPTPPLYTPVQKEDSIIFLHENFELLQQRMEQDRERQRRKEDNSGFMKTGNVDEEMGHLMMTGRKYVGGKYEQEAWKDETEVWREARSYA